MQCGAMQLAHWFITSNYSHNYHKLPICLCLQVCAVSSSCFSRFLWVRFDNIYHHQIGNWVWHSANMSISSACTVDQIQKQSKQLTVHKKLDSSIWLEQSNAQTVHQTEFKINRIDRGILRHFYKWHQNNTQTHDNRMVQITFSSKAKHKVYNRAIAWRMWYETGLLG